jgi:hypothetical protein
MNHKKLIIGLLAGLLVLAGAAAAGYAALPQAPGQIELSAAQFDFGTVPNTGPVSHTFQVTNAGQGPLEITGLATSCGCTSATIASRHLAPGASTELAVTYDPLAHDGATGQFMRFVYVRSDDPKTPEASLTIYVTVVEP